MALHTRDPRVNDYPKAPEAYFALESELLALKLTSGSKHNVSCLGDVSGQVSQDHRGHPIQL